MPWIRSCLCHQEKKKPTISPPIHLLLKPEGPANQNHAFRCKVFKKPRPCHLCHQPILHQGSCCRVCKYVCHKVCESKTIYGQSVADLKQIDTRIIKGYPAKLGQFPWQAGIFHIRNNRSAFCGGSLIHREWVLTAAHCVYGMHSHVIRIGTTISIGPGENTMQVFKPSAIYMHESFNVRHYHNDVALLRLNRPAIINAYVQPIMLGNNAHKLFDIGTKFTLSGWGKVTETGRVVYNLNYANLEVVSNTICQRYFDLIIIPETMCCVGRNKENACSGDSGGPLVKYNQNGNPIQVGIVSFGLYKNEHETLCTIGAPTGYVRVAYYRQWIYQKTGVV